MKASRRGYSGQLKISISQSRGLAFQRFSPLLQRFLPSEKVLKKTALHVSTIKLWLLLPWEPRPLDFVTTKLIFVGILWWTDSMAMIVQWSNRWIWWGTTRFHKICYPEFPDIDFSLDLHVRTVVPCRDYLSSFRVCCVVVGLDEQRWVGRHLGAPLHRKQHFFNGTSSNQKSEEPRRRSIIFPDNLSISKNTSTTWVVRVAASWWMMVAHNHGTTFKGWPPKKKWWESAKMINSSCGLSG